MHVALGPREKRLALDESRAYPPWFKDVVDRHVTVNESTCADHEDKSAILDEFRRQGLSMAEVERVLLLYMAVRACGISLYGPVLV